MFKKTLIKLFGFFLLVLSFLPVHHWYNFSASGRLTPYFWLIITSSAILLSLILSKFNILHRTLESVINKISRTSIFPAIVLLLIFAQLFTINLYCFNRQPHLIDSIIQVFQAKIFANFQFTTHLPELSEFFVVPHFLENNNNWSGQYPPGHSFLLALGELVRLSEFMPVIFSLTSAWLIYAITKTMFNISVARISLIIITCSTYFLAMGSSYMNHVSELMILAASVYSYLKWQENHKLLFLVIFSLLFGFSLTIRPLTSLAVGLVFLIHFLQSKPNLKVFLTGAIATSIGLLPYPIYNFYSTGSFFLPGYLKLWGDSHKLGFHQTPWGENFTPIDGLKNQLDNLILFNELYLESMIPGLTFLAIYLIFYKANKNVCLLTLAAFSIPFAYIFYWHNDPYLGPRMLYSSLIFIIPLTSFAIYQIYTSKPELSLGSKLDVIINQYRQKFILVFCLVNLIYIFSYSMPSRLRVYASRSPSLKSDIIKKFQAERTETKAIIFVHVSWVNRIYANLRSKGVSASLTEKAFRSVDYCKLHILSENLRGKELVNQVTELVSQNKAKRTNSDLYKTIYIEDIDQLTPDCIKQIEYDSFYDYTNYAGKFYKNNFDFSGNIIILRDLGLKNKLITQKFPSYKYFIYHPNVGFSEL